MRYLVACLFGFVVLVYTNMASAYSCTTVRNYTINPGNINVPADAKVGDKIGSTILSNTGVAYTCPDTSSVNLMAFGYRSLGEYAMSAGDGSRIYKTNIQGIGYALGGYNSACGTYRFITTNSSKFLNDIDTSIICIINYLPGNISVTAQIQFYKIAETTGSGTLNGQVLGYVSMADYDNFYYPTNQAIINMGNAEIISPGCTVNTSVISVVMGDVVKNLFNGIGTTVNNKTANFNIGLNCPANTAVLMQIDGNILDASKGLLNITSDSTSATGVAIQVLHNGLPLSLASPVSVGTAIQQGSFTIPLQARYYQSGATVTPGTANGTATFTMTYQ